MRKKIAELWRKVAHRARCAVEVADWMCYGAWICSAEEMRDEAGYEGGTR